MNNLYSALSKPEKIKTTAISVTTTSKSTKRWQIRSIDAASWTNLTLRKPIWVAPEIKSSTNIQSNHQEKWVKAVRAKCQHQQRAKVRLSARNCRHHLKVLIWTSILLRLTHLMRTHNSTKAHLSLALYSSVMNLLTHPKGPTWKPTRAPLLTTILSDHSLKRRTAT